MEDQILRYLIPASGLISGLIGAFVGLQNRALLAEVRKELAELENRIIIRINGTYVRTAECRLRDENVHARLESIVEDRFVLALIVGPPHREGVLCPHDERGPMPTGFAEHPLQRVDF